MLAGLWVIYMSLYAGWHSQFSALQGGMEGAGAADTVDESLQIVVMTCNRATNWFEAAIGFSAVTVTL